MKKLFLLVLLIFTKYICFAQPVISSFAPQAALPQSQITITGSGFSAVADSNIVYFGAVRAIVNAASVSQLTVTVPMGASYSPLSVTNSGLTGYSQLAFDPVAAISLNEFTSTSFEAPFILPSTLGAPKWTVDLFDMDNDGKQDIAGADSGSVYTSLVRNISQKGVINNSSFKPEIKLHDPGNWVTMASQVADFDGDGKKDFAYLNNGVTILKNTSFTDSIQFTSTNPITAYLNWQCLAAGDMDGDGRIDIVASSRRCCVPDTNNIVIFKNVTLNDGQIAFVPLSPLLSSHTPPEIRTIAVADVDGDTKPDILYGDISSSSVFVRINTSTANNVSFSEPVLFTAVVPWKLIVSDIDNDARPDIICINAANSISILRNTSSVGNISFADKIDLLTDNRNLDGVVCDFDGDGKPEIACAVNIDEYINSHVALYKNNSTPGNILFSPPAKYKVPNIHGIAAGDMDGDGKQDIVAGCFIGTWLNPGGNIAVLRNKLVESQQAFCTPRFNPDTLRFTTALTGTNYRWQVSTDSVNFLNVTNNFNFSGSTTSILVLIDSLPRWHGRQFRCMVNGTYDKIYTVTFKNTWTGAVDSTWENAGNWSCNTLPDAYTDVIIPNGTAVLGSNTSCRSIKVSPGASLTVLPGFSLTVTH